VPADSVSIRIYSGIARFPCDSMAFLLPMLFTLYVCATGSVCLAVCSSHIRYCLEKFDRVSMAGYLMIGPPGQFGGPTPFGVRSDARRFSIAELEEVTVFPAVHGVAVADGSDVIAP